MVAEKAAKSFSELQIVPEESDSPKKEEEADETGSDKGSEDESEKRRKAALDNLENASEESLLGQASFGSNITLFEGFVYFIIIYLFVCGRFGLLCYFFIFIVKVTWEKKLV